VVSNSAPQDGEGQRWYDSYAHLSGIQYSARSKKELPTVVLDPGHGGDDSGAVEKLYLEKDVNLDIAIRTAGCLKKRAGMWL